MEDGMIRTRGEEEVRRENAARKSMTKTEFLKMKIVDTLARNSGVTRPCGEVADEILKHCQYEGLQWNTRITTEGIEI